MPAIHRIDTDAQLIVTTWEGKAIDIDLINAIKRYQEDYQSNPDCSDFNEIVDFRQATSIKLTTEGLEHISEIASETDEERDDKKLALIVKSNLAFGLARMYEVYRGFQKNATKEIRVFKNENKALEWVKK